MVNVRELHLSFVKKLFTRIIHWRHTIESGSRWFRARYKHLYDFCYLKYYGVETEIGNVILLGRPIIKKHHGSRIVIDSGVVINSDPRSNPAGINHPTTLATLADGALIHLKAGCKVSGVSICSVEEVVVGENTLLGANVSIYDTDFHPIDAIDRVNQNSITDAQSQPVLLGNDVWLGANVQVLKGVSIGDKAVVGAGSVVIDNIHEKTLFAGNPAKYIRDI